MKKFLLVSIFLVGLLVSGLVLADSTFNLTGKITAISGSTISVVNDAGKTYSVNLSNASLYSSMYDTVSGLSFPLYERNVYSTNGAEEPTRVPNYMPLTELQVNDVVVIEGALNGEIVTASKLVDNSQSNNRTLIGKVLSVANNQLQFNWINEMKKPFPPQTLNLDGSFPIYLSYNNNNIEEGGTADLIAGANIYVNLGLNGYWNRANNTVKIVSVISPFSTPADYINGKPRMDGSIDIEVPNSYVKKQSISAKKQLALNRADANKLYNEAIKVANTKLKNSLKAAATAYAQAKKDAQIAFTNEKATALKELKATLVTLK